VRGAGWPLSSVPVSGQGVGPSAVLGPLARLLPSAVRGADQVALNIGEASENGEHQAPGAGAGVGPRFRQGSEFRLGVDDPLDDAEQVEGAAGEAVDPRHGHHVAGMPSKQFILDQPHILIGKEHVWFPLCWAYSNVKLWLLW
jgi:hypothetical protein